MNALWPRSVIATAAAQNLGGDASIRRAHSPEMVADAAYVILTRPSREFTGNFCVDEQVLRASGVTDFSKYSNVPKSELLPDSFL